MVIIPNIGELDARPKLSLGINSKYLLMKVTVPNLSPKLESKTKILTIFHYLSENKSIRLSVLVKIIFK